MRTLTIKRCPDDVGSPHDIKIICDGFAVGNMKADEMYKTIRISKGGHVLQCEIAEESGNNYRSNALFLNGNKSVLVSIYISGSRVDLKKLN